ncbi:MAG: CoA ester lyase [Burkholderiales bacterium]|nr:CoA ester lyase [Burkholderiales bacterium]
MTAISYLFVPGDRPDRFVKALISAADCVVLDLEDAVISEKKDEARTHISKTLLETSEQDRARILVRLNDVRSPHFENDLRWLQDQPLVEVMLSKTESDSDLTLVLSHMRAGSKVLALIESVKGIAKIQDIAGAKGLSRLAFGSLDYMLDLDISGPGTALDFAAIQISMASRLFELPAPVAGVTPALDASKVRSDALHEKTLGFGAKLCIHPVQVPEVLSAFLPSKESLGWAEKIVGAWEGASRSGSQIGALKVDGQMVDKPVLIKAQRILALVKR